MRMNRAFLLLTLVPSALLAQPTEPLPIYADDEVSKRLDDLAANT